MRSTLRRAAGLAAGGLALLAVPGVASAATVSVWHMDEGPGAGSMRDSLGSHNGSLDHVTSGVPGLSGLAYSFSGTNSVVRVASAAALSPGSKAFAITVHAKFSRPPSAAVGDYDLLRKGLSSETGGYYKMEIFAGGQAHCQMGNPPQSDSLTAGPDLSDNQWHEITCLRQGSTLAVIVDGRTFSKPANIASISNGADITVGAKVITTGIADQYSGALDEVSYSNEGAVSVSPPAIGGAPVVGSTLSVNPGAWNAAPVPAPTFAFQWQRCAGTGCTPIAAANGATYTVQPADAGATLKVAVTATSLGKATTATSALTALVQNAPPRAGAVPGPARVPVVASPPTRQAVRGVCAAGLRATFIRRAVDLRRGRSTLRFDAATRRAALHAPRGAVRAVRFTLDGRTLRAARDGRHVTVRRSALSSGTHVLRAIVTPRRGRVRTLSVRLTAGAC
jgi:hypothetical protein